MARLSGYTMTYAGIIGLFFSAYGPARNALTLPKYITPTILTIASIALVLAGVFLILTNSKRQPKAREVPIYEFNKIIGYRRIA